MKQEEKAKAYDEAIERAKNLHKNAIVMGDNLLAKQCEIIFPELKESKDERIRKSLISILKSDFEKDTTIYDISVGDIIAWLEKQTGTKVKDFSENREDLSEFYKQVCRMAASLLNKEYDYTMETIEWYAYTLLEYAKKELEKQCNEVIDCPQNYQDINCPNGCIVLEDFNSGEGRYKLHLDYLNKKQVEEVEEMVKTWNERTKTFDNESIKACIEMCLTDANEQRFKDYETTLKDCLAWLEKQDKKEQDARWESLEKLLDADTIYQMAMNDAMVDEAKSKAISAISELAIFDLLKPIDTVDANEEKVDTTNKFEPKFRKGQWIVWKDKCYKVNDIGCGYELIDQNGLSISLEYSTIDKNAHLWDITKDAKDGDVLATDDGNVCVFDGTVEDGKYPFAYYGLTRCRFESYDRRLPFTHDNVHPATKEQRETLMKAMTDAGYEWDAEKKELKELKKMASKIVTDFSDIRTWKYIVDAVLTKEYGIGNYLNSEKTEIIAKELQERFGKIEQKPSWSEEDERNIAGYNPYKAVVESIAEMCKHYDKASHSGLRDFYDNVKVKCKDAKEYDSLFPQNTWKPSDEQMIALRQAISGCSYDIEPLLELETKLKELISNLQ